MMQAIPVDIEMSVEADGWSALGDIEAFTRRAVEAALTGAPDYTGEPVEISVLFADDGALRELNRAWRGQDKPTNVLSFPAPEIPAGAASARPLGDMALAFETLDREAKEQNKPLADHAAHLLVHGTLHLLGHDHELEHEAQIMEQLETEILARIGVPDPYRDEAARSEDDPPTGDK